jgi:hypothetical protein
LQFLDSDDLLLPNKLEDQLAALAAEPGTDLAYGWTRTRALDGGSGDQPVRRTGERFHALFPALLAGRIWITATPLYRSELHEAVGGWSSLRLDEDWELEARLAAHGARLAYVEKFVAEHRQHAGERAGRADWTDLSLLSDRATARRRIFECARFAEVPLRSVEMSHFARELFLLARRCGAAGQPDAARSLFDLARQASTPERARGWDFRMMEAFAAVMGWRAAGRWSLRLDRWRRSR